MRMSSYFLPFELQTYQPLRYCSTSAGMDEAREADWPITSGAFVWHGCESLPDSDAPATPYGGYLSYFYHCTNIVVLMCMVMFQAKFTARPKVIRRFDANVFNGHVTQYIVSITLRVR